LGYRSLFPHWLNQVDPLVENKDPPFRELKPSHLFTDSKQGFQDFPATLPRTQRPWYQAQRMGLTLRAITYYEGESTNPSLQFIEKAAKALGITQGALLGTEWKEQPLAAANQDKGVIKTLKLRLPKLGSLPRKDQESLVAVIDGLLAKGAG
jgi:transcriptional regulator with XRE-family HTH domain